MCICDHLLLQAKDILKPEIMTEIMELARLRLEREGTWYYIVIAKLGDVKYEEMKMPWNGSSSEHDLED